MERQPQSSSQFQIASRSEPLVLLRDTERSLRRKTVATLAPLVSAELAARLGEASLVAEESLEKLAEIDLAEIDDRALQPARILVGLTFVGFGALAMVFLMLGFSTLHPDWTLADQMHHYWYPYVLLVGLGVAGMFTLGREAMRPPLEVDASEAVDDRR